MPKDLCILLVTDYEEKGYLRVLVRWRELEAQAQIADLRADTEACRILGPKDGSVTLEVAAKTLGVPARKLGRWMQLNGWAYRRRGRSLLEAYARRIRDGFLEHALTFETDLEKGMDRTISTMMITEKGMALLTKRIRAGIHGFSNAAPHKGRRDDADHASVGKL